MAQTIINLSGEQGLYKKTGTYPYKNKKDNNLIYTPGSGFIVDGVYNPERYKGYIAPSIKNYIPLDINTESIVYNTEPFGFTSIAKPVTIPDSQLTRWFLNGSNLFEVKSNTNTINSIQGNITKNIQDIIFYQQDFYYIYDGNIHRQTDESIKSSGINPNFWMTNIADNPKDLESVSVNARFVEGNNNMLYVLDNNVIHSIDSSVVINDNGRIDAEILTFPKYVHLIEGIDFKNKLYITYSENNLIDDIQSSSKYKSPSRMGVFVWNKQSLVGNQSDIIFVEGVNSIDEIFHDGYAVYILTVSSGGTTQIRKFNGSNFITLFEFSSEKDGSVTDQKIGNRFSIKTTEQGTFFVTNFGDIYLMSFNGETLHKVNQLKDIPAKDYEGVEVTKVDTGDTITKSVAHRESDGLSISIVSDNKVRLSTDGFETYTESSLPTGDWKSICYSDTEDLFVLVGIGTNNILTTTDGITFNGISTGSEEWNHVICNGQFVVVGNNGKTATSTDGLTWSVDTSDDVNFVRVAYSDVLSLYVAGTDEGQMYTSGDGEVWTERIQKEVGSFKDITYNNTGYYIIRENNNNLEILRSQDLIEWNVTATSSTYKDAQEIQALGTDLFISVGIAGKILKVTSNGTSISDTKSISGGNVTRLKVVNGILVALSTTGKMETTSDGTTWTERTTGVSVPIYDIEYVPESKEDEGDDYYIAVGHNWVASYPTSAYPGTVWEQGGFSIKSTDLTTWTNAGITKIPANRISYGNKILVCSADFSFCPAPSGQKDFNVAFAFSSNNGTTWTLQNSQIGRTQEDLSVAIKKDLSIAFLSNYSNIEIDEIYVSTYSNANKWKNWTKINQSNWAGASKMHKINNLFFYSGQMGSYYNTAYSLDGINWGSLGGDTEHDIAYGNSLYVSVGYERMRRSTDFGNTFNTVSLPFSSFRSYNITYGNGLFVTIGTQDATRMYSSPDGITWTRFTSNINLSSADNSSLYFVNGFFYVKVGTNIYRSADAVTWSLLTIPATFTHITVDETMGRLIGYDSDNYYITDNGTTWITKSLPYKLYTNSEIFPISFENGKSVFAPRNNVYFSGFVYSQGILVNDDYMDENGWYAPTTFGMNVKELSFNKSKNIFVAVREKGFSNKIEYVTFTTDINNFSYNEIDVSNNTDISSLKFINNNTYLVNKNSNTRLYWTNNFTSWNGLGTTMATGSIVDIGYYKDRFLASTKGSIYGIESADGITWQGVSSQQRPISYFADSPTKNYLAIAGGNLVYTTTDLIDYGINPMDMYNTNPLEYLYTSQIYWNPNIDRMVYLLPNGTYHLDGIKTISPGTEIIDTRKDIVIDYFGYHEDYVDESGIIRPGTPMLNIGYEVMNKGLTNGIRFVRLPMNHVDTIKGHPNNPALQSFSLDLYPNEGNVLTGVTLLPKLGIVRNLTIYCNPVPNEEPALKDEIIGWIDVYLNQSKTPVQTKAVTRFIASKGYIDMELNRQNANAIQIGIRWNTEHKTGDNDMLLSQAVLTYEPRYSSR